MVSIRVVIACGLWLLPAAVLTARRGVAGPAYAAGLAVAAAGTAAVVADQLVAYRGDQVTDSCLAALQINDALQQADAEARRPGWPLRSVLSDPADFAPYPG